MNTKSLSFMLRIALVTAGYALLAAIAMASFAMVASAQSVGSADSPELRLGYQVGEHTTTFRASLDKPVGNGFLLVGHACDDPSDFDLSQVTVLGSKSLAPGDTTLEMTVDNGWLESIDPFMMHLAAVVLPVAPDQVVVTPAQPFLIGVPACEQLSFNFTASGEGLEAGEEIQEQWAAIGFHVSAENKVPGHPDKVIIYDSSNPTPEDPDLVTPGYGDGNDEALGNLMIVAENDEDGDGDGLVDVPDDEAGGGIITMDFDDPVTFCSITLVDLDDGGGSEIRFYDSVGTEIGTLDLMPGGDNSVQTIGGLFPGVSTMEVDFVSSGGIASFAFMFCPTRINFDLSTTGVPTGLEAGEVVTSQFAGLGLEVSANSFGPHDQAILFDTDAPTGGDFDLGAANQGLVLIIPEDTTDGDGDGMVDDPDDERDGGVLILEFDAAVQWQGATVLDVDFDETVFFEAYDATGALITTVPVPPGGDGSVQIVTPPPVDNVSRLELHLSSSGALAGLLYCPDPFIDPPAE